MSDGLIKYSFSMSTPSELDDPVINRAQQNVQTDSNVTAQQYLQTQPPSIDVHGIYTSIHQGQHIQNPTTTESITGGTYSNPLNASLKHKTPEFDVVNENTEFQTAEFAFGRFSHTTTPENIRYEGSEIQDAKALFSTPAASGRTNPLNIEVSRVSSTESLTAKNNVAINAEETPQEKNASNTQEISSEEKESKNSKGTESNDQEDTTKESNEKIIETPDSETNNPPIAMPDTASNTENQSVTMDVLANDTDSDDNATFSVDSIDSVSSNVTTNHFSITDNQIVFNPSTTFDHLEKDATENVTVTYTMSDEDGATSQSSAVITVTGTNDGPVAVADTNAITDNVASVTGDMLTNDTDIDDSASLTLTAVDGVTDPSSGVDGDWGTLNWDGNGGYTYNLDSNSVSHLGAGHVVTDTFTYEVSDDEGATSTSTLTINITGTNDAPVAAAGVIKLVEDGSAKGELNASDPDANHDLNSLTFTVDTDVSHGTLSLNADGSYVYTPDADFTGSDSFVYEVTDPLGGKSTATISIDVCPKGNDNAETLVNTETQGKQNSPSVSNLSDGGFVILYDSPDANGVGISGQRYDSDSNAVGNEFSVNTSTQGTQGDVSVSGLDGGGFVATWHATGSNSQPGDTNLHGVVARVFDENGVGGAEIQVNTTTTSLQFYPDVTALNTGGFVVTWSSLNGANGYDIMLQRYDASGSALGDETTVNTTTSSHQLLSTITTLSNGDFVITWADFSSKHYDIKAQRFSSSGEASGDEISVNSTTNGTQYRADIVGLDDGGFVITWQSQNLDGNKYGIAAQQFDANGDPVGSEKIVNTSTSGNQEHPSITALDNGGYLIGWQSKHISAEKNNVYAQEFDSSGNPVGNETILNTTTANHQDQVALTTLNNGNVISTWESYKQDGNNEGVYFKTIAGGKNIEGTVNNDALVGSDKSDTLTGNAGNDHLEGGAGADTLDGGDGIDTAIYTNASAGVTIDLNAGTGSGDEAQGDTLSSIENLIGSEYSDRLTGDTGSNTFTAGGGDDVLIGGGGNDLFVFGLDSDSNTVTGDSAWNDIIELSDVNSAPVSHITNDPASWIIQTEDAYTVSGTTLTFDNGDGNGEITLSDGSSISFTDIDEIRWD